MWTFSNYWSKNVFGFWLLTGFIKLFFYWIFQSWNSHDLRGWFKYSRCYEYIPFVSFHLQLSLLLSLPFFFSFPLLTLLFSRNISLPPSLLLILSLLSSILQKKHYSIIQYCRQPTTITTPTYFFYCRPTTKTIGPGAHWQFYLSNFLITKIKLLFLMRTGTQAII